MKQLFNIQKIQFNNPIKKIIFAEVQGGQKPQHYQVIVFFFQNYKKFQNSIKDTFRFWKQDGSQVNIDERDIAWNVDIDYNYKQTKDANKKAWVDVTNEHFMVWMRTSGMGRFKKLWGRIREDLPAGKYTLEINNQYNSTEFNGQKYVLMTTSTPFGQKNLVLIVAYFSGAFVCIVSIIVLYTFNKSKKDK